MTEYEWMPQVVHQFNQHDFFMFTKNRPWFPKIAVKSNGVCRYTEKNVSADYQNNQHSIEKPDLIKEEFCNLDEGESCKVFLKFETLTGGNYTFEYKAKKKDKFEVEVPWVKKYLPWQDKQPNIDWDECEEYNR